MLSTAARATQAPAWSRLLELRTTVIAAGREFLQLQLLSDEYILTRIGDGTMIFLREGGRRYTVDRIRQVLRPLDAGALWEAASGPSRSRVAVSLQDGPVEVDGYSCRRLTVESRVGLVTLSTESFYASISGVERTPLHEERVLSAPDGYPAHLLDPSEILVSARTTVRQGNFEQVQTSILHSVRPDPEDNAAELEPLDFPRIDSVA